MTNSILLLITSVTLFFACQKVVELDIEQSTPQIVIEGLLSDKDTVHYVKVSRSIQFYETGLNPVENANVVVIGEGNSYTYSHNPLSVDSLNGYYFSDIAFAGKIGEVYALNVNVDGINYDADDTMRHVTPIDSLTFELASHPSDEDVEDGKLYQALLYAQEPEETEDYYQFQFFRNDTIISDPDNIYVFSDIAFGPTLNGLQSPVLFREGELASVQIYSLTREQFIFYSDLANLLNNDGGMFSPPPANPRNTFTNNALGLWQVSAISEDSIRITP
jgi:uncharacterized protein DUF4249